MRRNRNNGTPHNRSLAEEKKCRQSGKKVVCTVNFIGEMIFSRSTPQKIFIELRCEPNVCNKIERKEEIERE